MSPTSLSLPVIPEAAKTYVLIFPLGNLLLSLAHSLVVATEGNQVGFVGLLFGHDIVEHGRSHVLVQELVLEGLAEKSVQRKHKTLPGFD